MALLVHVSLVVHTNMILLVLQSEKNINRPNRRRYLKHGLVHEICIGNRYIFSSLDFKVLAMLCCARPLLSPG